ncbi:MAG TPA: ATP-binding protein [Oligoflexia bacterium]|nr:ATP-binding protein [Oligoflexia bacterium]
MNKKRYLSPYIESALAKKMVFIGGPRQVGKTTLSLGFLKPSTVKNPQYLNWDNPSHKSLILKNQIPLEREVVVLDEVHKYRNWRNLIKGIYDTCHEDHKIIVTGSARLDYFRKGGDSLLGRYRYFRLHPFSLGEVSRKIGKEELELLLKFGGFPEPFINQNESEHRIWQKDRIQKIVYEDLRDLENVKDISLLSLLAEILPSKVGAPLSLKSLEEDLGVSQPTIDRWVKILNVLYYCFTISPFGAPKIRAVKKLQKVYMWDWSQVEEAGFRFENLVASHLLKYCHFIEDTEGHSMELRYLRDTDGREIDFVVLKNKKPLFAVECKTGEKELSKHIEYFRERTSIPEFYQVHMKSRDYGSAARGRVLPFTRFVEELGLC